MDQTPTMFQKAPAPGASAEARNRLAYEAGTERLKQQTETLAWLRERSAGMFSIAALIASLSASASFTGDEHPFPLPVIVLTMAFMTAVGICTTFILWPLHWSYGPRADAILHNPDDLEGTYATATTFVSESIDENDGKINLRMWVYRFAGAFTLAETLTVIAGAAAST